MKKCLSVCENEIQPDFGRLISYFSLIFYDQERKSVLARFACGAMRKGNLSTPQKLCRHTWMTKAIVSSSQMVTLLWSLQTSMTSGETGVCEVFWGHVCTEVIVCGICRPSEDGLTMQWAVISDSALYIFSVHITHIYANKLTSRKGKSPKWGGLIWFCSLWLSSQNFNFINYLVNRHTNIRFHILGSLRDSESKTVY